MTAQLTVRATLAELGLWAGAEGSAGSEGPGLTLAESTTMASPSWWGADSRRWSVRADAPDPVAGAAAFVKVMEPHARAHVDVGAAFGAAREAGAAGIGPEVLAADVERGVLVLEDLTDTYGTATVDRFDASAAAERLVTLRRAVHRLPAFARRASVFDDLRAAHALAVGAAADLPVDLDWMLRLLEPAQRRIEASGYDPLPCHGDGNVSNVLVERGGTGLRLVDWDLAATMDPLQDLGVLLHEIRPFDTSAREVFEMYWGHWDGALFDRCRVYGIADCVRWGLLGRYAGAVDPGTHEYAKFADWQFLRARAGLRDPHFDDRLANL
jgi:aminoglycoside phosphotransferase (APT) family kinase protein